MQARGSRDRRANFAGLAARVAPASARRDDGRRRHALHGRRRLRLEHRGHERKGPRRPPRPRAASAGPPGAAASSRALRGFGGILLAALALACGGEARELEGHLGPGDPLLTLEGSYYDAHEVPLGPGWTIDATMRSTELDALLLLLDPEGTLIVEADGGAGGHDARLRATAPRGGRYRLVATSFYGREEGTYRLRILTRAGRAEPHASPRAK